VLIGRRLLHQMQPVLRDVAERVIQPGIAAADLLR
jgi:hypothetical protein